MDRLLGDMKADELVHFCEGTLRAATRAQRILEARFPEAWAEFDRRIQAGEIK